MTFLLVSLIVALFLLLSRETRALFLLVLVLAACPGPDPDPLEDETGDESGDGVKFDLGSIPDSPPTPLPEPPT